VLQVVLEGKQAEADETHSHRYYSEIMEWADKERTIGVRTNADQPDQAANAVAFGAEGIGLCRTEHMFFEGDRIMDVREMILADDRGARGGARPLLPMQRDDFEGIFRVMGERPVTIRTLDPPLHEFLPHDDADVKATPRRSGQRRRGRDEGGRAAREQPDARPPRLPPRHRLPRDHAHADARDPRSGVPRRRRKASTSSPRS
jgi:pyruvate, orthophosphate dikinase